MLFNSYIFIFLFLPVTLLGYYLLNHFKQNKLSQIYLIGMSLWFYAYFNYWYLFIILASVFLNYLISQLMLKNDNLKLKKLLVIIGILGNLGILFYYKYMGFFVENINSVFGSSFIVEKLILPLGISFFTFQQLSYVVDSYRGTVPRYQFREYALFVTFFPQLIAGPIVLHSEIIPQFTTEKNHKFNIDNFVLGIRAFSIGLAKKVLVADVLGEVVTFGYDNVGGLGATNAIIVMLCYTFQIYFDFSGYCDMATGIGRMFNIEIPMNFNSPYKALTIDDFWKRWHITLTRFLRLYIYFPLGGNRKGTVRTYVNLFIVFLISGLWHGANYTFIVWGLLHGIFMVINRIFKKQFDELHPALNWMITFGFVNITWVIFRANTLGDAATLIKQILKLNFSPIATEISTIFMRDEIVFVANLIKQVDISYWNILITPAWLMMVVFIALGTKNTNERISENKNTLISAVLCAGLICMSIISFSGISTFLYFNF